MRTHGSLTEDSRRTHGVTGWSLPTGREGKGIGREGISRSHPSSSPTSRTSPPVDNATAATTSGRLAWMALRAIGGGC